MATGSSLNKMAANSTASAYSFKNHLLREFSVKLSNSSKCSNAWKYFGTLVHSGRGVDIARYYCKLCLEEEQRKDSASNMIFGAVAFRIKNFSIASSTGHVSSHLRSCHGINEDVSPSSARFTLEKFLTVHPRATAADNTKAKKWLLTRDILLWFCRDNLPFEKVKAPGFADFARKRKLSTDEIDLPHPTTLSTTALFDVYDAMMNVVRDYIKQCPKHCAVTMDMWTDSYFRHKYIGSTLHFIDTNWKLCNLTLRVANLQEAHTAENIQREMRKTLHFFDLSDRNIVVIRDEGANIKKACRDARLNSYGCIGHGLHNLIVADGISRVPEIQTLLQKCRRIVRTLCFKSEELMRISANVNQNRNVVLEIATIDLELTADTIDPIEHESADQNEATEAGNANAVLE